MTQALNTDETTSSVRILHIIGGLQADGSQQMLLKLVSRMDRRRFLPEVISLTDHGALGHRFVAEGIPLVAIEMSRRIPDLAGLGRLVREIRRFRPHLVQTWGYQGDVIGGIASRLAPARPLVWNVRNTRLHPSQERVIPRLFAKAAEILSRRVPDAILCCSHASEDAHKRVGYPPERMTVIPNGFDLDIFHPDPLARVSVRHELSLPRDAQLIILVARFYAQKDHQNFFRAAALVHRKRPDARFVCCGTGATSENRQLLQMVRDARVGPVCHLLGHREDVPRLLAAADIAVSSSDGEGFSNAVGEAMACGTPCVVTDVGESARLVGDTGEVVPPQDGDALAKGIASLLGKSSDERRRLGVQARSRIGQNYSIGTVTSAYQDFYVQMASPKLDPDSTRMATEV